jgi:NADH-quinone oxidoreductase subunit L
LLYWYALAMVLGVFGFLTWKLWPHLSAMLAR